MKGNRTTGILIILIAYITTGMLGVYLSVFQYTIFPVAQLFNLNIAFMGVLIGVQSFGMLIAPLILGGQNNRIGKRKVLLVSYLLLVAGTIFAGVTFELAAYIIAVFIIGAGYSVTEATIAAVLADEFPDKAVRHLSFSQTVFSAGALLGPVMAEGLIKHGVFFKDLYTYIGIVFILLGGVFGLIRQKNDAGARSTVSSGNIIYLLRNRAFVLLAFSLLIYIGAETVIAGFMDGYFELVVNTPENSAIALSLFWGAMIPSRFLVGVINLEGKKMMAASLAITVFAIVGGMVAPWHTAKLAMFALCGFGCGPQWPLLMNEAAKRNPGSSGMEMNTMVAFGSLGAVLFPLLAGFLADASSAVAAYYFCAVAVLVILILVFRYFLGEKRAS